MKFTRKVCRLKEKKEANNSKKKKSIKQNKKVGERTGFKGRVNV